MFNRFGFFFKSNFQPDEINNEDKGKNQKKATKIEDKHAQLGESYLDQQTQELFKDKTIK